MRLSSKSLLGFLALVVAACSAGPGGSTFGNTGGEGGEWSGASSSSSGNGSGGTGGGFIPGTGGGGGGGPIDDCSAEAKLVYVLSDANELYSFDPPTKQLIKIGTLGCNAGDKAPNSMAVDRSATAWVNYVGSDPFLGTDTSGAIYKVSTKDASCAAAPNVNLISNYFRIGMGFSTNDNGIGETLYIAGTTGSGLAKIDPNTNQLTTLSGFSPGAFVGQSAELTGTGDGRLYGYFTTSPVQVGQIDKATAAVTKPAVITGLATPSAWAFSFWGGSFYLYAASAFDNSSVTKYNPATGTIENGYVADVGFRIVGAGVSTCAPIEPPK